MCRAFACAFAVGAAAALAAGPARAQFPPGTQLIPGITYGCRVANPAVNRSLERLRRERHVREGSVRLVEIDLPRLRTSLERWVRSGGKGELALRLANIEPLRVQPGELFERTKDIVHWSTVTIPLQKTRDGVITGNAPVLLTFVPGGRLRGTIDLPGQPIRVEPLGGRCHAVYEVDPAGLPKDHPVDRDTSSPVASPGCEGPTCPAPPPRDANGYVVLRVAVAFTDEAAAASLSGPSASSADPLAQDAEHWIERTNRAMAASGMKVRLELVPNGHRVGINETARVQNEPGFSTDPARLTWHPASLVPITVPSPQYGAPARERLTCWWNRSSANLLVLIVKLDGPLAARDPNDACGLSSVPRGCASADGLCRLLADPPGARGKIGYAWVRYACANASHAFAHEVGHMLGADHERDTATSERGPNPPLTLFSAPEQLDMGYAFTTNPSAPATGQVTVMGSFTLTRQRVPMYSTTSPAAASVVDGQTTWGGPNHDNARLMEAVAVHMAGRPPPACEPWPSP